MHGHSVAADQSMYMSQGETAWLLVLCGSLMMPAWCADCMSKQARCCKLGHEHSGHKKLHPLHILMPGLQAVIGGLQVQPGRC